MLSTTQSYVRYQGNGATTVFPFGFIVPTAGELVVTITNNNVSPAAVSVLSASQYSVAGLGNATGGIVTYPVAGSALPTGWTITIQKIVPYQQNTSLSNQAAFYPQVVEAALDNLCMQIQQLAAALSGMGGTPTPVTPTPPPGETLTGLSISGPSNISGGSMSGYAATATFSDGSSASPVAATWSVSPTIYAGISSSGILTTNSVPSSESATITASYTYEGVTETATFAITITQGSSPTMSQFTFLSSYAGLAGAVSSLGSTSTTLIMDVANSLSANLVVPANINLVYLTSGVTTIPTGVTLTINGLAAAIAMTNQMFNCQGTGAVVFSNPQYFICPQHFGADDTGTVDASTAIQQAVKSCMIVTMTNGNFLINGQITMPQGVHIIGRSDETTIQQSGSGLSSFHGGTLLNITNTTSSPFIYQSGNLFQGLTFTYPNQSPTQATPTSYPAAFSPNTGAGTLTSVQWADIQFANAYFGIDARVAHVAFTFRRLRGCPIAYGLRVDGGGADVFEDFSFAPAWWYAGSCNAATWMAESGTAIDLGLVSDFRAHNLAISGYFNGINPRAGTVGSGSSYGVISDLAVFNCENAIFAQSTGSDGIHITNLMADGNIGATINLQGDSGTFLRISSGVMIGTPVTHVLLSEGALIMEGVSFSQPQTAVIASSSGLLNQLQMIGCRCRGTGTINLSGATLVSLILVGNLFGAAPTFASTPATTYRYVGNTNLADH